MITYGIIGFGGIAENRTAREGFALDKERFPGGTGGAYRLYGATDPNQSRQPVAESYGLKWYPTTAGMLADPDIDAVYIATPNSVHATIAKQAVDAGKHVLMEKPMTSSVESAKELCRMANEAGISLSVNLMMSKNSLNIAARNIINSGKLGHIDHIVTHMEFLYGSTPEEASTWRCAKPDERGGPIGDVASHCMFIGEFLYQDTITSLKCTYTPKTLPIAVEDGAVVKYRTARGHTGTCKVAFNLPTGSATSTLSGLGYEVFGDKAALYGLGTMFQLSGHKDEPYKIRLVIEGGDSRTEQFPDQSSLENLYQAQIREHAESIINGTPLNGYEGLHNLILVDACYRSADAGGAEIQVS